MAGRKKKRGRPSKKTMAARARAAHARSFRGKAKKIDEVASFMRAANRRGFGVSSMDVQKLETVADHMRAASRRGFK